MSMLFEVLMDHRENPDKCTIHPLKERKDFRLRYFKGDEPIAAFESDLLLHVDGECLSTWKEKTPNSIAVIDCNWKKVAGALTRVALPLPKLARIPDSFQTAYPRRNKEGKDPEFGLATIEALFIAAAFLGVWDETLLDHYYFRDGFLAKNQAQWEKYKLGPYAK